MQQADPIPACAFHPDRETRLTCTLCDRPACPDCLSHAAVGQHCVGCSQGRPAAGEKGAAAFQVRRALLGADDAARMRRPGKAFFALLLLFTGLCVVAWFGRELIPANHSLLAVKAVSIAIIIVGAVISLAIHEWAHAFVAYHGGDRTVASKGYLTLDPRNYTDPVRSFVFPMVFLLLGGLPLPGGSVWINHALIRGKWWDSAISLAGPASNFVGAVVLVGVVETGVFDGHPVLGAALMYLAYIEFAITFLNLIPFPGLDGYGIIEPHLPDGIRGFLLPARQWTMIILLLLFMNTQALDFVWIWSDDLIHMMGGDGSLLGLGYDLANPQLF